MPGLRSLIARRRATLPTYSVPQPPPVEPQGVQARTLSCDIDPLSKKLDHVQVENFPVDPKDNSKDELAPAQLTPGYVGTNLSEAHAIGEEPLADVPFSHTIIEKEYDSFPQPADASEAGSGALYPPSEAEIHAEILNDFGPDFELPVSEVMPDKGFEGHGNSEMLGLVESMEDSVIGSENLNERLQSMDSVVIVADVFDNGTRRIKCLNCAGKFNFETDITVHLRVSTISLHCTICDWILVRKLSQIKVGKHQNQL